MNKRKNKIIIKRFICKILLTNNKGVVVGKAIIDKFDLKRVSKFTWYKNSSGYVFSNIAGYLHRFILGINNAKEGDHKDRNKLNNRRDNLRKCNDKENSRNVGLSKNNTTGAKGVYFRKRSRNYYVQIVVNCKTINLGTFSTVLTAAKVYNKACKKYHKEFACLNDLTNLR